MDWECIQCGNCCRAGFDIVINLRDVEQWIKTNHINFIQHIKIDPKCISEKGLAGYHIEKRNILEELRKKFGDKCYDVKKKELIDFIKQNHRYLGEDIVPLPIYTVIPGMERRPILVPKSFEVMQEGLKKGLIYILKYEKYSKCPFMEHNKCSIHDEKPSDCRAFPYDKEGNLRYDDYLQKICKGFRCD